MYVKRLSIEDERILDRGSPELEVTNPSWDQIENAILKLDGKYRTIVIIGQENTEFDYMVIGGGNDGVFWCGVFDKAGFEFVLIDPSRSSTDYVIVPTGQPTKVPARETACLTDVIIAAREYAETGGFSRELTWDRP